MDLLDLLVAGLLVTSLDIDNALYLTAVLDEIEPPQQRRVIFWGLAVEFVGRLAMVWIFGTLFSATTPLFTIGGIPFTVESLALLGAGLFLTVRSARELIAFFRVREETDAAWVATMHSFGRLLLEVSVVSLLLSIDTVVAVAGMTTNVGMVLYLFLFSAVVRFLFVREIARFINRFPGLNILILAFLITIGLELLAQGLSVSVPEPIINSILLGALILAIAYRLRQSRPVS